MNRVLIVTLIVFFLAACTADKSAEQVHQATADPTRESVSNAVIPEEVEIQNAKSAIMEFADSLKTELKKALDAGGPVNAITVCNTRAVSIASEASKKSGLHISRVSARNRNPGNAPNEWQQKVLENFEQRKLSGEPVTELSYAATVDTGRGKEFRFMKAIPTGPLCLVCHGTDLAPEVISTLDKLYPADKARGFHPGDIRGAFVVTKEVAQ